MASSFAEVEERRGTNNLRPLTTYLCVNKFEETVHVSMSGLETGVMAKQEPIQESDWQGVEKTVSDEEEAKVIFCSLDSFL